MNRNDLFLETHRTLIAYLDENKEGIEFTNTLLDELITRANEFANMHIVVDSAYEHVTHIRDTLTKLMLIDAETFQDTVTQFNTLMTIGSLAACLQAVNLLIVSANNWQSDHYIGEHKQAALKIIREKVVAADA